MENGLENLIKHEELGDKGAGSPGNDPSSEGGPGPGHSSDTVKPPKSDTPEPRSRARNHTSGTTVGNTGSASLAIDNNPIGTGINDDCAIAAPSTTSRKGHKRKAKLDSENININDCAVGSKIMGLGINQPDGINQPVMNENHCESSVKDLENAMSKHLPSPINNNNNTTTDFSADSLLKQDQEKSSTIQWIGHHHNPFHQQAAPMPATALLRQLYANRESVIRATARQSTNGVFYPGNLISNLGVSLDIPGHRSLSLVIHYSFTRPNQPLHFISPYSPTQMVPQPDLYQRHPEANHLSTTNSFFTGIHKRATHSPISYPHTVAIQPAWTIIMQ